MSFAVVVEERTSEEEGRNLENREAVGPFGSRQDAKKVAEEMRRTGVASLTSRITVHVEEVRA